MRIAHAYHTIQHNTAETVEETGDDMHGSGAVETIAGIVEEATGTLSGATGPVPLLGAVGAGAGAAGTIPDLSTDLTSRPARHRRAGREDICLQQLQIRNGGSGQRSNQCHFSWCNKHAGHRDTLPEIVTNQTRAHVRDTGVNSTGGVFARSSPSRASIR